MPILAFSTLGIQCKEDLTKSETISTDSWQIETSNGQEIPAGWEPFNFIVLMNRIPSSFVATLHQNGIKNTVGKS